MRKSDTETGGTSMGGIRYCIRSGATVTPTVLMAEMGDGALVLQSWRVGPSAQFRAANAGLLGKALAADLGSDLVIAGRSATVRAQL